MAPGRDYFTSSDVDQLRRERVVRGGELPPPVRRGIVRVKHLPEGSLPLDGTDDPDDGSTPGRSRSAWPRRAR